MLITVLYPWRDREIGIVGVRKGNVRLHLPPLNFFHNTAMTVQYLINLMKYIN